MRLKMLGLSTFYRLLQTNQSTLFHFYCFKFAILKTTREHFYLSFGEHITMEYFLLKLSYPCESRNLIIDNFSFSMLPLSD